LNLVRIEKRAYLLIIRYSPDADETINRMFAEYRVKIKNKTMLEDSFETTYEVSIRKGDTSFLKPMREIEGVEAVTLVEYTGDYA
jgi:hypothetical protein